MHLVAALATFCAGISWSSGSARRAPQPAPAWSLAVSPIAGWQALPLTGNNSLAMLDGYAGGELAAEIHRPFGGLDQGHEDGHRSAGGA
jgi:hypothetical protein